MLSKVVILLLISSIWATNSGKDSLSINRGTASNIDHVSDINNTSSPPPITSIAAINQATHAIFQSPHNVSLLLDRAELYLENNLPLYAYGDCRSAAKLSFTSRPSAPDNINLNDALNTKSFFENDRISFCLAKSLTNLNDPLAALDTIFSSIIKNYGPTSLQHLEPFTNYFNDIYVKLKTTDTEVTLAEKAQLLSSLEFDELTINSDFHTYISMMKYVIKQLISKEEKV
jgi:hypothetical protein